ncbi:prepilin-type N-terminal cleavage/methylation domain-containing protein [Paucibacter sp. KBW04]|uniref:prepilin-type N-terminal cleavage/methylation domain-containing protein n=1 Tax=Paucibacter sp. KBW04 TaxID=2153361 RepID=UPI001E54FEFC|nr:prepilin-type N-terminal cleavage/methylation domain-containing protein [Paucibacter sp. KBW04]
MKPVCNAGPRCQGGLSLIETMVCVALMMILAAAATPFALAWADQAAVRQTHAQLRQGMSQLKATALQNPAGMRVEESAAVLLSLPGRLCVQAGAPQAMSCENAVWQATVPAQINIAGASTHCLALGNSGLPVEASLADKACASQMNYRVSRGKEISSGTFN